MKYFTLDKIVIIVVLIISSIFYHISPSQYISDDSIFYLVIAKHIVEDGFSTFNGYIETNGYHPLWMIFNIISIKLSSFSNIEPLNIIGFIYQIFFTMSIYFLFKIEDILKTFSAFSASLILIFLFIANGALHNLESSLALFFVIYTLYYILIQEIPFKKTFFLIGILLGLTVLSRLDLIFFGLIVVIYILIKYKTKFISFPLNLLYFMAGGLLVVVPYFIYNQISFGGLTPISGALKSTFPHIKFTLSNIFPYGIVSVFFALIAFIIAVLTKLQNTKVIFYILSLSTMFHVLYLFMFQHSMTWYYITGFLTISLVVGYIILKLNSKLLLYLFGLFMITIIVVTSYIKGISDYTLSVHILQGKQLNYSKESQMKIFSKKIKEKLPLNASIFTWDSPGILAYYGGFRVFSADGLITNKIYQKELVEEGAIKVFKKYDINYILVPLSKKVVKYYDGIKFEPLKKDNYLITIYSRLYHKEVAKLKLFKKDILFTVNSPYAGNNNKSPKVAIFKIPIYKK